VTQVRCTILISSLSLLKLGPRTPAVLLALGCVRTGRVRMAGRQRRGFLHAMDGSPRFSMPPHDLRCSALQKGPQPSPVHVFGGLC